MAELKIFIHLLVESEHKPLIVALGADKPAFYEEFVSKFLQQLMEKIDKIREVAGRGLQSFF